MKVIGIDAGGTSHKVLLQGETGELLARHRVATREPSATAPDLAGWINHQREEHPDISSIGIASFGPIDRNPASTQWGQVGVTTKQGWEGFNLRKTLEEVTGLPCALDTDVNGALLAECDVGAGAELADVAYLTIGTGVGGAAVVNGSLIGAPWHGEFGHVRLRRDPEDIRAFSGSCAFHGDCVEGLASAKAIRTRWGVEPHELAEGHAGWREVSAALAQLCHAIACLLAPQRIILGGGLMLRESLLDRIRVDFAAEANGYASRPEILDPTTYLVSPVLGDDAGAIGGATLARRFLDQGSSRHA